MYHDHQCDNKRHTAAQLRHCNGNEHSDTQTLLEWLCSDEHLLTLSRIEASSCVVILVLTPSIVVVVVVCYLYAYMTTL